MQRHKQPQALKLERLQGDLAHDSHEGKEPLFLQG